MKVYKCDKCGKIIEEEKNVGVASVRKSLYDCVNTEYQLCHDCLKKLKKFLQEK